MRIITGKARGAKLETLEGELTRPTSERTKEAVFSMLQFDIQGKAVLDLFAGSGQIGLEALSRGAQCAYMVDRSKLAIDVIKRNIAKTRLEGGAFTFCEDSLLFLKRYSGDAFDIVFLDPPYATDLIGETLKILSERGLLKSTSKVICESDRFEILDTENSKNYEIIKAMKHGVAHVTVLKVRDAEEI